MTLQVICIICSTPSKSRDSKVIDAGLQARKTAFKDIETACKSVKAELNQILFEKLDFGETEALDHFYNADVAIVDMSMRLEQNSLFYHIGVRETMGIPKTVILINDTNSDLTRSVMLSCGTTEFIPYGLDSEGKCMVVDPHNLSDSGGLKPSEKSNLLAYHLKKVVRHAETASRTHIKEKFLNDLRKARENLKGKDFSDVLANMRKRMDEPQLISSDIILNMLLSYRDIQDYNSMVDLVEALDSVAINRATDTVAIQHLYAFALNRRKEHGDREKALQVIKKCLETLCETPVPDLVCLCGRIYKDIFVESLYKDQDALKNAIEWYEKGFETQPNEYAGINLATLLVISGKQFATSPKLQQIALTLNNLIGRKGNLYSLNDYWTVATYFEISVLAEDYTKAVQAAECMMKLEPPIWYLNSTLANIQLLMMFRKDDGISENKREKELFNFWIDFFTESTKTESTDIRIPVLVLEPQKILMPSYIQINEENEGADLISIWHVAPQHDKKFTNGNLTQLQ